MNSNYGYILIDTPEKKRHYGPIQKGDEYQALADGTWKKEAYCIGSDFCTCHNGRRPLVLPDDPEWELVPLREVPQVKCEVAFASDTENWKSLIVLGTKSVEQLIEEYPDILAVRRRKSKGESGDALRWIPLTERLPRPDEYPCWVVSGGDVGTAERAYENGSVWQKAGYPSANNRTTEWDKAITHFCPKPKLRPPSLPEPPKPAHEIACEKWFSENERKVNKAAASLEDTKVIWNAALNWKESQ